MSTNTSLKQTLYVDEHKCVNCHACITACPVKFCNIDKGNHMSINKDLCISCGSCVKACQHEARIPIDDFEEFMARLKSGEKFVAVVAPAVAASFPDTYLQFNGWLKSLGIQAVFDVSFGAELTIKSYLEALKVNPQTTIAQPCPAIVSYIEIYQPQLLPYLAPADSPMMHTVKMVKEFYPEYRNHSVMMVSPCIAKSREFEETRSGVLNVILQSFHNYLNETRDNLRNYDKVEFDNPPAERAVLFSSPGGLMRTAVREVPEVEDKIRKIEGIELIYDYLENLHTDIQRGIAPLVVDCLNCDHGCNGGTGTVHDGRSLDEIEHLIEKRKEEAKALYEGRKGKKKLTKSIDDYWKPGLYVRTYTDKSRNYNIVEPTNDELWNVYHSMKKYTNEDLYNCSSCGYGTCEKMATAVHNNLNSKDNCHYYSHALILELSESVAKTIGGINERFTAIKEMLAVFKLIQSEFNDIESAFAQQTELVEKFESIANTIQDVSQQTNMLSINASIEAARAGNVGKGFAVVAAEVKRLAESTNEETSKIKENSAEVRVYYENTMDKVSSSSEKFVQASELFNKVSKSMSEINNVVADLDTITSRLSEGNGSGVGSGNGDTSISSGLLLNMN